MTAPRCPYGSFTRPADPAMAWRWDKFMAAATDFRAVLALHVPDGPNRNEALVRLDKAVMVASGAYHVHPG